MVERVKSLQLILDSVPFKVLAKDGNGALIKKWDFTTEEEAINAFKEIDIEVKDAKRIKDTSKGGS